VCRTIMVIQRNWKHQIVLQMGIKSFSSGFFGWNIRTFRLVRTRWRAGSSAALRYRSVVVDVSVHDSGAQPCT
jgi:hypothetical protein